MNVFNGNITQDLSKNISAISYNLLNLPDNIYNTNGDRHSFLYDYDGNKLYTNTVVNDGTEKVKIEQHWVDNMYYENWKLKRINIEGGYGYITTDDGVYHFYQKDHLGNNRLVVNQNGNIEQTNHYYPYGMTYAESTSTVDNPYKYNGKELDSTNGINLYDYSARYMDPTLGRFTTMDPMAEKYYSISPYVYCIDNPINAIDTNGKIVYFVSEATSQFKAQFTEAVQYLNEKGAGEMLAQLNASSKVYYISPTIERNIKHKEDAFDSGNQTIYWNPALGTQTTSNHLMSPTALLNHEVDHALGFDTDPKGFNERSVMDKNNRYGNPEDQRVITGSEQITARKLGEIGDNEVTRTDHLGNYYPTAGVTSTKGLNELDEIIVKPNNINNDKDYEHDRNNWGSMPSWGTGWQW